MTARGVAPARTSVTHRESSSLRTELGSVEICLTGFHPSVCRWHRCRRRVECVGRGETNTFELCASSELDASFAVETENALWSLGEAEANSWLGSCVRGGSSRRRESSKSQTIETRENKEEVYFRFT